MERARWGKINAAQKFRTSLSWKKKVQPLTAQGHRRWLKGQGQLKHNTLLFTLLKICMCMCKAEIYHTSLTDISKEKGFVCVQQSYKRLLFSQIRYLSFHWPYQVSQTRFFHGRVGTAAQQQSTMHYECESGSSFLLTLEKYSSRITLKIQHVQQRFVFLVSGR